MKKQQKKLQYNNKFSKNPIKKNQRNIKKNFAIKNLFSFDKAAKFRAKNRKKKIKNHVLFFKIPKFFKSKTANKKFSKKIYSQISLSKVKFQFEKKLLKKSRFIKAKKYKNKFFKKRFILLKKKTYLHDRAVIKIRKRTHFILKKIQLKNKIYSVFLRRFFFLSLRKIKKNSFFEKKIKLLANVSQENKIEKNKLFKNNVNEKIQAYQKLYGFLIRSRKKIKIKKVVFKKLKLAEKKISLVKNSHFFNITLKAKRPTTKLLFNFPLKKNFKNIWKKLFFSRSIFYGKKNFSIKNKNYVIPRLYEDRKCFYPVWSRALAKLKLKRAIQIPFFLRKHKKLSKPMLWMDFFSRHDYLDIKYNNRTYKKIFVPWGSVWTFSKKVKKLIFWKKRVYYDFIPKSVSLLTEQWRPRCRSLFAFVFFSKKTKKIDDLFLVNKNIKNKQTLLKNNNFYFKANICYHSTDKKQKKSVLINKHFLTNKKLNTVCWAKLRKAHRFSSFSWNKKTYFHQYSKNMRWRCRIEFYKRELIGFYVPFKFQHTQKNPAKYYRLSRWDHKANRWLTPIAHLRKLSWWQLRTQITLEKRHPHRYKSYKAYMWFTRTLCNRWNYGMRVKKNYRLKQIMFGRIVLPAFNYLGKNQFFHIKKNVSKIKPLGLQHSRPALFLGKFERRLDILTYKLNFAPTIQWARSFVAAGLLYVSYLTFLRTINYSQILIKKQKFPLHSDWKIKSLQFFAAVVANKWRKSFSYTGKWQWNMPLSITLPSYLVRVKGIIHWSSKNITNLFYQHFCNRYMPRYFIYNKKQTVAYFWRNLRLSDIDRQRSATRIKWNTIKWLL